MANGTGNARMFFEDDDGDEHEITDNFVFEPWDYHENCQCWFGAVESIEVESDFVSETMNIETEFDFSQPFIDLDRTLNMWKKYWWPYMPGTPFSWN